MDKKKDNRPPYLRAISFIVRGTMAILAEVELFWFRVFRLVVRPRYQIEGYCRNNGACCHHILIEENPFTRWRVLHRIGHFWLCQIYRFRPTENAIEMPNGRLAYLFTCDNLTDDNRCGEYYLRPLVCRKYPQPRYFTPPGLHSHCNYRVRDTATGYLVYLERKGYRVPFSGATKDLAKRFNEKADQD